MKPEMGLWSFLERHSQSPRTRARLYYQGKVTEGSADASSQYIVNSMTYLVGYFPFCDICWCPNYLFSQRMKVKENGSANQRQNKIEMEPRNRSLLVFTWRCQDANTIAMYGLSKSFTIKFLLVFNILKYSICNITNFLLILWWLTGYECGCYLLDRRNVLWRDSAVNQMEPRTAWWNDVKRRNDNPKIEWK